MKRSILLFASILLSASLVSAQSDAPMGLPPGGGQPPMGADGKPMGPPPGGKPGPGGGGQQFKTASGMKQYSKDATVKGLNVTSKTSDKSAVYVNKGTLNIQKSTLANTADASSTDDASFYGVNAVLCAQPQKDSKTGCTINSQGNHISGSGLGANGMFAYGKAVINSVNDVVEQTGGNARGIMASGGGTINVVDANVTTRGHSSSCVATDRGGGTINISGGTFTCYGANSAGIYSTGVINAANATFISNGGEGLVIEGTNYINLANCHVTSKFNKWGVLLYQSFSGDAEEGDKATLCVSGGSINYEGTKTGLFYNTNNRDSLCLSNVTLTNASDTLINCKKGGWGNRDTARRGGKLSVETKQQQLEGLICADADSQVLLNMKESSCFSGAFNPDNTAQKATLLISEDSQWNVTKDSYVNGLLQAKTSSIQSNGHNIYYSTAANPQLQGQTFDLNGGGKLLPM